MADIKRIVVKDKQGNEANANVAARKAGQLSCRTIRNGRTDKKVAKDTFSLAKASNETIFKSSNGAPRPRAGAETEK